MDRPNFEEVGKKIFDDVIGKNICDVICQKKSKTNLLRNCLFAIFRRKKMTYLLQQKLNLKHLLKHFSSKKNDRPTATKIVKIHQA